MYSKSSYFLNIATGGCGINAERTDGLAKPVHPGSETVGNWKSVSFVNNNAPPIVHSHRGSFVFYLHFITTINDLSIFHRASQESVKPMEESLDEINDAIKDQLDQIYQIKLNIIKNNHKIQQLLDGRA